MKLSGAKKRHLPPSGGDPLRARRSLQPAVALAAVLALSFAYFLPASGPEQEAKVERVLDDIAARAGGMRSKSGDSPAAGQQRRSTRRVLITPKRGQRARIGGLAIPAIGVRVSFFEGIHDAVVKLGPGHWPGTPFPGAAGNAVLAGHRTTFTKPFADLDLLKRGDAIKASVGRGPSVVYRVTRTDIVAESDYDDHVLRQPRSKRTRQLTLFACTPKGQRTHRIVVTAVAPAMPRSKPLPKEGEVVAGPIKHV